MRRLVLLACMFVVCAAPGCPVPPSPPPVPPQPVPAADAGVVVCTSTTAICAYCDRMRVLGCPEGRATPKGTPCETVTENVQSVSYAAMDLPCRTRAKTCADANGCR